MDKDMIKHGCLYICGYLALMGLIWFTSYFVAKATKTVEVVQVNQEVECAVVSRMFNTSVDCWKK